MVSMASGPSIPSISSTANIHASESVGTSAHNNTGDGNVRSTTTSIIDMNPTTEGTTPATSSGSSGSVNSTSTTSHATMDPILAKQQKIPSVTTSGATIAATAVTTAANNALHPMMDALQTSETAMSTSTPSWQLPHSSEGMVPLRLLIDRLTAKAYTDLQNLVEIMPGMPDSERKRHLLDYIVQTRQAFIRLLVLVRWAANASNIQRCQDIMGYLRQQSHQFGGAVHTLWVLHQTFHRAKLRNYDLATAVDILGSGSYQRLPTIMKSLAIPPAPMSEREKKKVTERLDDLMRTRLFCDERPPPAFRHYEIDDGIVRFRVENEFEVALTLDGAELSKPWRVMEAHCLVKADPTCCREVKMNLANYQNTHLMAYAQQQLLPKSTTTTTTNTAINDMELNQQPLYRLYGFMHHFSLMTQLEIMFTQALYLSRTRWEEHMTCSMDTSHTIIRLNYWCRKVATSTTSAATRSFPQQSISALPISRVASESMPNCIDILLESTDNKETTNRSDTISTKDKSSSSSSSARMIVKCSAVQVDMNKLIMDATAVNVEKLLLAVVKHHAFDVATTLRERLLQPSAQPDAFIPNEIGSITLPTNDETTEQVASIGFVVQYQTNRAVSVGVDIRTGRILFDHRGDVGHVIFAKLKEMEGNVNREPNSIAEALLRFRRELLLVDLESMSRRLGLLPVRQLFLRPQDWSRFGEGFSCVSFFRLPKLSDAYIVSGVKQGRLQLWLVTAGSEDEHCMRSLSYMTTIHFDRLQKEEHNMHSNNSGKETEEDIIVHPSIRTSSGFITFSAFAKMVLYCQTRILYLKIEQQLIQLGIRYRWSPTTDPSSAWHQLTSTGVSSDACLVIRPEDIKILGREYAFGAFGDIRIAVTPVSNSPTDINASTITMANKQVYHIYFKSDIQWTSWFDWSRAARHDSVFVKDKTLNIVCSDIVTCIDVFITNWQRVLHISHLAQQLASTTWREQYGVEITRFDFRQLVLEMKKLHDPTSFVTMNIQWTSQVCEGVLRERRGEYRLVVDRHTTLPTLSLLEQHLSRHGNLRSVIELSNRTLSVFDTIQMACPTAQIYARDVNRIRVYHTDIKYGLDILLEPNGQLQLIDVKEWIELKSPITATTPTQPTLLPLPPTEWTKLLQIDWRPIEVLASTSAFSKFFTAIIEQQQQIDENNDIDGELVSLPGTIICHDPIHHGTRRSVGSILLVHLLQQWSSEVATTTSTTTTTTSATITTSTANTPTTANTTMSNTNNNNSTTMNATAVVVTEETTDGNDAIMTMMV